MSFVTYAHTKPDGTIFYIGKGIEKRAYQTRSRNQYWKNIVAKHGFKTVILANWKTEQEAFEHEKVLIACFKDMGYQLANLTNGGEGNSGYKHTKEQLAKRSGNKHWTVLKGLSEENKAKLRMAMVGRKHSEETKLKMKETHIKNGTHNSRPIEVCGVKFRSITNFAKFVNKTPIWVKKCVDNNRVDKLEEYYRNATK